MKKYLLIFTMLILTGCSTTVNINMDDNYDTSEEVIVSFDNSLSESYDSVEEYADVYLDYYKNLIIARNYNYKVNIGKEKSNVTFTNSKTDVCNYVNNNLFSVYLYEKLRCTEDELYYIIESEGENSLSLPQNKKKFDIENLSINVKLPVEAEYSNADIVNDNTYTWKFDKYTGKEKSIYLKISKNVLKKNKNASEVKEKLFSVFKILIIVGVIAGIIYAVIKAYNKNNQNNLEY